MKQINLKVCVTVTACLEHGHLFRRVEGSGFQRRFIFGRMPSAYPVVYWEPVMFSVGWGMHTRMCTPNLAFN